MGSRVPVYVYARDPVSQSGIRATLRDRPGISVVEDPELDAARVAVVAADEIDEETIRVVKALQRNGCPRVVLVAGRAEDSGLLAAVEAGVGALLRRQEATPEALERAVESAAAGDGTMPPDLLGRLLSQLGRLQQQVLAPRGLTMSGLSERELGVLRLVADGYDTGEIAVELAYSERTIKNIIHDVTTRFQLRNRSHAVAFVLRQGLI